MKIGQKLRYGHYRGIVISIQDENNVTAQWPAPQKCMCKNHPGPRIRKDSEGNWWCQAQKQSWKTEDCVVTPLDRGFIVKLVD